MGEESTFGVSSLCVAAMEHFAIFIYTKKINPPEAPRGKLANVNAACLSTLRRKEFSNTYLYFSFFPESIPVKDVRLPRQRTQAQ